MAVADAVTGEALCRVSSDGLDLENAVQHARRVGGPSLHALRFPERAAVVKSMALALSDRKEELYELSARAGATRSDAKVDVDGGFGTALVYSSIGRKALPDGRIVVEDEPILLGKEGRFVGRHVLTSRRGLALQINAFNFPVWGMLEKLAPALLAGVPTIVKPATPTAFITEHAVRIMLEAGVLPDGALQLVCGFVPGVLDQLGGQDLVGFTGSAATAARLRAHDAVTRRSVRFTAEADSLNSSILGPDAVPGTPEFDIFVDQVVVEMTTKAGQKCTAIRRAFVPHALYEATAEAIAEKLAAVVVGAPDADGVTMGALVGLDQREDVRTQIAKLSRSGDLLFGDPGKVDVVGADAERGAFLSPILLGADPDARAPHEVEAFGPVCTLLPFADPADVPDLVARGEGSLVASMVSADADFVRSAVVGIAAHHGRLVVLDQRSATESTGHGIPMPQLVHGGPGRAGGGEEAGGLRAVYHHLQRTAVQGGPEVVDALARSTSGSLAGI
ncbi:phenylacetic acid degradation bifunctional protein PaaZ (plasmid) [Nocardioides sp. R1-1]|uniref:phenylacetic acid degradation bifunctional protein PaaZ n=1 Tax=Nocardioides sp. R1-1 TaxID=3383502 RepID=UPI0038D1E867